MTSSWIFPGPAELQVPAWNTVEFNQTIVVYLSQQASTSATTGFGSNRAVFIGDTIDVHWGAETDSEIDRYCLVCSEPYFGIEGWPACENFSSTKGPQLYVARLGYESYIEHRVTELTDQENISAAVCAFGINTPSRYELSSAFPLINREHEDDDGPYTFSEKQPSGMDSDVYPTATLISSATIAIPTVTATGTYISDPRGRIHNSRMSTAEIVAAVIGALVGVSIIAFALFICWRRNRSPRRLVSQATHMKKPSTSSTNTYRSSTSQNNLKEYASPRVAAAPRQTPRPFVRDRLSAAERGDAPHRQDTSDLPPPAYEEVVVTAARDADRAERERTNSTARDQSADSRWSRFSNYDDMTPISPNAARMGQK